jgi:predicted outer membrane repeat protein
LTKGFTTPVQGFKHINIGNDHGADDDGKDPVHISIDGKGVAVIDAHGQDRIFAVGDDSSLSITGVILLNGNTKYGFNGGAILVGGHLELLGCTFKNCTAAVGGGAVGVEGTPPESGSATITDCTFDGNSAQNNGGAVEVREGSAVITSCTFKGGAGSFTDSVDCWNGPGPSKITFACPPTSTGAPVITEDERWSAEQLPPATEIVHCTPKLLQSGTGSRRGWSPQLSP